MQAVIFVGIQASGKSTFFKERFFDTHVRISRDLLRTRNRERILLAACTEARQPFVVDNTNPRAEERAVYAAAARAAKFQVVCYYFRTETRAAIGRNNRREGRARVPIPGLLGTYKKLQEPHTGEGYDEVYVVTLTPTNEFVVEPFDPVPPPPPA